MTARVLRDRDDGGRAVALFVEAAHDVARPLRRDHDHVVARWGLDAPVVHVEAVREEDRGAVGQVRRDLGLVQLRLRAVGDEERDELCAPHRVGDRAHGEARPPRRRRATALSSRRPTSTSTPDSCRFSAWACPWLPYPSTATLPLRSSMSPCLMISAMWWSFLSVQTWTEGVAVRPPALGRRRPTRPVRTSSRTP